FSRCTTKAPKKITGAEDHGPDQQGIPAVRNKRRLGHRRREGAVICGAATAPKSKLRAPLAGQLSVARSRGKLPKRPSQSSCHLTAQPRRCARGQGGGKRHWPTETNF